jgi:hypothetical protein
LSYSAASRWITNVVSSTSSSQRFPQWLRFSREQAAALTVLTSMPITLGAAVREGPQALRESGGLSAPLIVGKVAMGTRSWRTS